MTDKLSEAFAKDFVNLQSELMTLPKNEKGYGYNYTSLDTIITAIKPILKKNHFAFTQTLQALDGKNGIMTMLIHESGETLSGFCLLPEVEAKGMNKAQQLGCAVTYMKRYGLSAILGISTDDDTDGVLKTEEKSTCKNCGHKDCKNCGTDLIACKDFI